MDPGTFAALRSNRAVMATAAAVVAIVALVGLARVTGIETPKPVITAGTAKASAAPTAIGVAPEQSLAPGETLVAPPVSGDPMMPHYSAPQPPPAAPNASEVEPAVAPPVAAPVERPRVRVAPRAEPQTPSFARGDPHPSSPLDTWPMPPERARARCETCGEVVVVTVWPDMSEVRVRFEDGRQRTLRAPAPSRWRVGDRVRLEQGRLVRD